MALGQRLLGYLPLSFVGGRVRALFKHPAFYALTFLGNGTILLGAAALYSLEKNSNSNLHSFLDSLWWAVATVTTVGHGDVTPVTTAGKILGIAMMIFGTAFFCSFTALFATVLLRPEIREVEAEVRGIEHSVQELQRDFATDEQTLAKITASLEATLQELRRLKPPKPK